MSAATWKSVITTCVYIKMKVNELARPYSQKRVMPSASYIKLMFNRNHLRTGQVKIKIYCYFVKCSYEFFNSLEVLILSTWTS